MNPFDLRGPEFLGFYLALGGLVFALLWVRDRVAGPRPQGQGLLRDPYLIAGLRGGAAEMTRVAALACLARGALVQAPGRRVARAASGPPTPAPAGGASPYAAPIEGAILLALASGPRMLAGLERYEVVKRATRAPLAALREQGLLPSEAEVATRRRLAIVAGVVLLGVAAIKLVVALQRGRVNVGFLILLALLFAWGLVAWARARPRTQEGLRVLRDLRGLFGTQGARAPRAPLEGSTQELLLLAAVGGIAGGPFFAPADARRASGSSSSGCGTTSGCSSGCGGGCGGGGCGGCGS